MTGVQASLDVATTTGTLVSLVISDSAASFSHRSGVANSERMSSWVSPSNAVRRRLPSTTMNFPSSLAGIAINGSLEKKPKRAIDSATVNASKPISSTTARSTWDSPCWLGGKRGFISSSRRSARAIDRPLDRTC